MNGNGTMNMCSYCGALKGEYCGMASRIYRGGKCPKIPAPTQKPEEPAQ
jgi:hypothetical protein